MGSDAGRNFLSTSDPIRDESKRSKDSADPQTTEKAGRPFVLGELLRQLYFGRAGK